MQVQYLYSRIPGGIAVCKYHAAVHRGIINNNDLNILKRLRKNAVQTLAQIAFTVP